MSTIEDVDDLMPGHALDELDVRRALANVAGKLLGGDRAPAQVGRFALKDKIGSGGMGVVYSAFDPRLDRTVAIKLVHAEADDQGSHGSSQDRLLREARSLAKLRHPNIVTIHEVGTHEGRLFLAMEFIAGEPLDRWCSEARAWPQLVRVYADAGRGLAAAHRAGIVHRDFKPANVILGEDGRVTVIDFGLARTEQAESRGEAAPDDDRLGPLTEHGAVIGTPAYMAPEQHRGEPSTPASDQFAFCVSLHLALYGRLPFDAETRSRLLVEIEAGHLRPAPPGRAVPGWLRRAITRGLRPAAEDRWPDMEALLDAIDPAPRRRRRRQLGVAAVGVLGLAVSLQLGGQPEPCTNAESRTAGVWDGPTRAALALKFEADAAWPAVQDALDAFAEQWRSHWTHACRATQVDGTQSTEMLDKRMACLEQHRGQLVAFVVGLERGDANVLSRAAVEVSSLDPGERCGSTQAMLGRAPPPADATQRATFDRIIAGSQEAAARAHVLGQPAEALVALHALRAEAESLGHPRALRFVADARGRVLDELDESSAAVDAMTAALRYAETAGDDAAALDLASSLVYMYSERTPDAVKASMWSDFAENKLARVGTASVRTLVGLRIDQASALNATGEFTAAVQLLTQALESLPPQGHATQRGTIHHNRASSYRSQNEYELAVADLRLAVGLRTSALGPGHRLVGESKLQLSHLLGERDASEEADTLLSEAVEIFRAVEGADRDLVAAQQQAAIAAIHRGDLDRAITLMTAAMKDGARVLGPDAQDVAGMQFNLARMLMMAGRLDEALAAARRSLGTLTQKHGPHSPLRVPDLELLGEIQQRLGRLEEASESYTLAVRLSDTDIERAVLKTRLISTRLCRHRDVGRAQAEAGEVTAGLRALAPTPGVTATIEGIAATGANWQADGWDEMCGGGLAE